jgi:hypothetical protein
VRPRVQLRDKAVRSECISQPHKLPLRMFHADKMLADDWTDYDVLDSLWSPTHPQGQERHCRGNRANRNEEPWSVQNGFSRNT